MLTGNIDLKNLSVRSTSLDEFDLPLELVKGVFNIRCAMCGQSYV